MGGIFDFFMREGFSGGCRLFERGDFLNVTIWSDFPSFFSYGDFFFFYKGRGWGVAISFFRGFRLFEGGSLNFLL